MSALRVGRVPVGTAQYASLLRLQWVSPYFEYGWAVVVQVAAPLEPGGFSSARMPLLAALARQLEAEHAALVSPGCRYGAGVALLSCYRRKPSLLGRRAAGRGCSWRCASRCRALGLVGVLSAIKRRARGGGCQAVAPRSATTGPGRCLMASSDWWSRGAAKGQRLTAAMEKREARLRRGGCAFVRAAENSLP